MKDSNMKLKEISTEAALVVMALMEKMKEGQAEISGNNGDKIIIEHIDRVCALGDSVSVSFECFQKSHRMQTTVHFLITDKGIFPYRFFSKAFEHMLLQTDKKGNVAKVDSAYQKELAKFSDTWLSDELGLYVEREIRDFLEECKL